MDQYAPFYVSSVDLVVEFTPPKLRKSVCWGRDDSVKLSCIFGYLDVRGN
jgi:hypothetical protein